MDFDDAWADAPPAPKVQKTEDPRPAAAASALAFQLGARVVIHGLASRPEQVAHIVTLPTDAQPRFGVMLMSKEQILVNEVNLKASLLNFNAEDPA